MDPPHYLVFVAACSFDSAEEKRVIRIVRAAADLDRIIFHTWIRRKRLRDSEGLPRRVCMEHGSDFSGQTAALELGQALECVSADVPTEWGSSRVVLTVAPCDVFRDRLLRYIATNKVGMRDHFSTVDEFYEFVTALVENT